MEKMTVVHSGDPTTKVLTQLYEQQGDVFMITENNTNAEVTHAVKACEKIMMLGHGNMYGLFSTRNKRGDFERLLINGRHAEFLRNKICIGIWCHANEFAKKYGLHGLFSGMIISELSEAEEYGIVATKEEIEYEMEMFTKRLKYCLDKYELKDIPKIMPVLDDTHSNLTVFNYNNLYYYDLEIHEI